MNEAGGKPEGTRTDRETTEPPSQNASGNSFMDTAAGMLEGYAKIMSQLARGGAAQSQGAATGPAASVEGLTPALVEAWTIASASTLRYGQGLTEVFARHQGALLNAATMRVSGDGPTSEQQRAEAEALRQFLREVGDTATLEARRLEHALEQLGEAVAQGAAQSTDNENYKRSWAVKP